MPHATTARRKRSIRFVPRSLTLAVLGVVTGSCSSSTAPQSDCTFAATTIITPVGAEASGIDLADNGAVRVFFETPFSLCTTAELNAVRVSADADVHEIATAAAVSESVARKVTYDQFGTPTAQSIITASVDVVAAGLGETTVRLTFTHPRIDPPPEKSFAVRVQ